MKADFFRSRFWVIIFVCVSISSAMFGCGTFLTEAPAADETLDGPIDGLTPAQLKAFLVGDEEFGVHFTPAMGLGPIFNESSCASCHTGDGKGHPSTNLTRFGVGDPNHPSTFNYLLSFGGPQLQQRAIPGYQPEKLPTAKELAGKTLALSIRSGPKVVGLGLVEAIPEATILANIGKYKADGINGKPNYVKPPEFFQPTEQYIHKPRKDGKVMARFGRKATAINLHHQTIAAYINDMGLTTDAHPKDQYNPRVGAPSGDEVPDPEVPSSTVKNVVFYLKTLKPPTQRDKSDSTVKKGQALFTQADCAKCHTPMMKSGPSPIKALSNKEVWLYSDMLLHDMGKALADNYPEGEATGNQWRTTPLWGIGLTETVTGGKAYYMHDGQAKTLTEAIKLHGGEAEKSRQKFEKFSANDKAALLTFLRSL